MELILYVMYFLALFTLTTPAATSNCPEYKLIHTGCMPYNDSVYCGKINNTLNGSNGSTIGLRYAYDSGGRMITSTEVGSGGDIVAECARQCETEDECVGFVLIPSDTTPVTARCNTVNETAVVSTRLVCTSYSYQHDKNCQIHCGDGDGYMYSEAYSLGSRPVVSASNGGLLQCSQLCDRLNTCKGYLFDNVGGLCTPLNDTVQVTAVRPIQSYVTEKISNDVKDAEANVIAWTAHTTEHVFENDVPDMSAFCTQELEFDLGSLQGHVVSGQLALRNMGVEISTPFQFHVSDLTLQGGKAGMIPKETFTIRQISSVFAQESQKYANEFGSTWYPDALEEIYPPSTTANNTSPYYQLACSGKQEGVNGCRFSYDKGGRLLNSSSVSSIKECFALCNNNVACLGVSTDGKTCKLVNDTSILIDTSLTILSYRRVAPGLLLLPNITRGVWFSGRIPLNVIPGTYKGNITMTSILNPDNIVLNVPITLRIWNINGTCVQNKFKSFGKAWGFDHSAVQQIYQNNNSIFNKYITTMSEHGTPADALATPWALQRPISDIQELLSGPYAQPLFNIAFIGISNTFPISKITNEFINEILNNIAPRIAELEEANLLQYGYIYGFDEAGQAYEDVVYKLFGEIKRRWPQVKTLGVLNWALPSDIPVDIWVVQYEFLEQTPFQIVQKNMQANGKLVWGYHCISPTSPVYLNTFLDIPLFKSRLLPWLMAKKGVDGWLYWYTNWGFRHAPNAIDNSTNQLHSLLHADTSGHLSYNPYVGSGDQFSNEDGNIMYAGADGPIVTLRMQNLQSGFQDLALLSMLDRDMKQEIAGILVRNAMNYTFNHTLLEMTRERVANLLQGKTLSC
eukprot:m.159987 g.159987  ORF g.159987 m.159987 type:complete len:854 (-) comp15162_c0_seq3:42-2603(-)